MAKENWLKEIRDGIRNLETETARESFPKTRPHRLVLNTDNLVKGFRNAADMRAQKYGASKKDVAQYNTYKYWSEAIARSWDNAKTSGMLRIGNLPTTVQGLNSLGSYKGLYIETETVAEKTILAYPTNTSTNMSSVIRTKTPGGNPKDGFDTKFRKQVWKEWLNISGLEADLRKYNADVGSQLPSAHRNTLGQAVVAEYFQDLQDNINQGLEESFIGQFVKEGEIGNTLKKITDSIQVGWNRERIPNLETGELEEKRVITVDLLEVARNRNNQDDLQRLKPSIISTLENEFAKLKPMNAADAGDFETSQSFKDAAKQGTAAALVRAATKKKRKTVKRKKTPKPVKRIKDGQRVARKAKKYRPKKTGGMSLNVLSAGAKRPQQNIRKGVDETLKLTRTINKRLPAEVRRNMGKPALTNRTGIFSNSAELVSLRQTKAGLSGEYTYMRTGGGTSKNRRGVYETFENTGKYSWPTGYNPKPLIAKSIRNLAMQYTEKRLVSLRRI
tara:strand:- start:47 stop:1555 length:1509 start_codon:yes stop_codon:yes gene_type:complete